MVEFTDSIDIAAPPATVFHYLTTNRGMVAWMGTFADLDPVIGGRFAVDIAGHPVRGEFLAVEPPRRVVVSWGFEGSEDLPAGSTTVEFSLVGIDGGTRVELRHFDLPDEAVAGHADGWANFMPRLAAASTGADPGPDTWTPLTN